MTRRCWAGPAGRCARRASPCTRASPTRRGLPAGKVLTYNSSGLFGADGVLPRPLRQAPPAAHRRGHALHPLAAFSGQGRPWARPSGRRARRPRPWCWPPIEGAFPFSGMICFESIFGRLARGAVRRGSRCLMVITNDGWFGKSAGPRQHAAMARLRAAACAVPLVRSRQQRHQPDLRRPTAASGRTGPGPPRRGPGRGHGRPRRHPVRALRRLAGGRAAGSCGRWSCSWSRPARTVRRPTVSDSPTTSSPGAPAAASADGPPPGRRRASGPGAPPAASSST